MPGKVYICTENFYPSEWGIAVATTPQRVKIAFFTLSSATVKRQGQLMRSESLLNSGAKFVSLLNFIHFDIIAALRAGLGLRAINRPVKYVSNATENI